MWPADALLEVLVFLLDLLFGVTELLLVLLLFDEVEEFELLLLRLLLIFVTGKTLLVKLR